MGPVSSAVAAGCLEAMRWLLWLVAGLLVALVVVQGLRHDEAAQPVSLLVMALVAFVAGYVCAWVAARIVAANR